VYIFEISTLALANMFVCPALLLLHSAYFVGTTSTEETQLVGCCNFQGAFFRIDVAKGKIIWRTGMIPPNGGNAGAYAGAAIWGSSPSIDPVRNLVYIATGNLYSTPPSITACQLGQQNLSVPDTPDPCILPDDHSESVLALDLDTGSIHWAQHLGSYDTWVLACVFNGNPNCPPIPGPDADFAEAPMLIPSVQFKNSSTGRQWRQDILVVAQKSGFVYGLNPQDGSRLWTQVMYGSSSSLQMCSWVVNFMMKIPIRVQIVGGFFFFPDHMLLQVAGPGGSSGGAMWGSATDGQVVFTNIVNSGNQVFTLLPSRQSTTGGGWVALDAGSGEILWSTPTPDLSGPVGPVTVANGVLFTTSHSTHGKYYALDSKSGAILWNFTPNGSVMGGFSVANGCAFVGEGNTLLGGATPGRAFYGFCL
jgi:outer membrane protein assembly factor BamB